MLHLMPSHGRLPSIQMLLDDMGTRDARKIAHALGVTPRTVQRWVSSGQAPRVVLLALFWVSRWGQSALNAEAWRGHDLYRGLAKALERERDDFKAQLAKVGALAEFGSANDPSPHVAQGTPTSSLRPPPGLLTVDHAPGDMDRARRRLARLQRRLERRRLREAKDREKRKAAARAQRTARAARALARRQVRQRLAA